MKPFYFTFGQVHTHSVNGHTFDKDCVAVIHAVDHESARKLAFEFFKGVFATSYEAPPPMEYFPRGFILLNEGDTE